jgi:uncharacterized protein
MEQRSANRLTGEFRASLSSYRQHPRYSKEHAMDRMIFVNLPVKDLQRSMTFFKALGFTFNEQFTNEQAAYMNVNAQTAVMLVTESFFQSFAPDRTIADPSRMEVQNAVSAASRQEVDELVEKAMAAGARGVKPGQDEGGYMYSRQFQDPDGHLWDFVWMDPSVIAR